MLLALTSLSETERQVLHMRHIDGLPTKEIAKKIGRTDGAVRVILTRCRQKLQKKGHVLVNSQDLVDDPESE